jgi:hypothetical protein
MRSHQKIGLSDEALSLKTALERPWIRKLETLLRKTKSTL